MKTIKFYGYVIPPLESYANDPATERLAITRSAEVYNDGDDCWCRARNCASSCADCIFCCNYGDRENKCNAFADWLVVQGIISTRRGFERTLSVNMRKMTKRMKD